MCLQRSKVKKIKGQRSKVAKIYSYNFRFRRLNLKYQFSPNAVKTEDPNAAEKETPEENLNHVLAAIQANQNKILQDMQMLKEKLLWFSFFCFCQKYWNIFKLPEFGIWFKKI